MDEAKSEDGPARRLRGLSAHTKRQLGAGEQRDVEYKIKEINKLPEQAAAGANLVALDPNVDAHTILIGVEEAALDNGVKRGVVVGCSGIDGSTDLDKLRQRIESTILSNVVPPPTLVITEENTATDKPILVLTITPTDPPHRVQHKYYVRGNQGLRPLTQAELWRMFEATRLEPLLKQLQAKDPTLAVLTRVQLMLDDMSYTLDNIEAQREGAEAFALGSPLDPGEPTLGDIDSSLDELKQNVESVVARLEDLPAASDEPTPVGVWRIATKQREVLWTSFTMDPGTQSWPEERFRLAERLVRQHFAELPEFEDFAANYAEVLGGNGLWRAGEAPPAPYNHLARLCWAAVARALRNPFGVATNLVREGRFARHHTADLLAQVRETKPRDLAAVIAGVQAAHELAIVELPDVTAHDLLSKADAESPTQGAVIWHAAEGTFRIALPPKGSLLAVEFLPTASRQPGPAAVDLARELTDPVKASGGSVLPLSGHRHVFTHEISCGIAVSDTGPSSISTSPASTGSKQPTKSARNT